MFGFMITTVVSSSHRTIFPASNFAKSDILLPIGLFLFLVRNTEANDCQLLPSSLADPSCPPRFFCLELGQLTVTEIDPCRTGQCPRKLCLHHAVPILLRSK
jgi:hypothetical protein